MADSIKIGNLDISSFKVGSGDCSIYLGTTLIYSGGTPPTPTLQWVSYSEGDTIPASLIYGVKLYLDLGADNEIDFQDTQQGGGGIAFVYVADADGWYGIDIDTSSEIDLSSYYDSSEGCYIVLFSDLGYGGLPIMYPSDQFEFDIQLYEEHVPTHVYFNYVNGQYERGGFSYTANTDGNLTKILKTASSSGELTTCKIAASGVTSVKFTQVNAVSGSGFHYSATIDGTITTAYTNSSGAVQEFTGLSKDTTYYISVTLRKKTNGSGISGTNASANITWTQ